MCLTEDDIGNNVGLVTDVPGEASNTFSDNVPTSEPLEAITSEFIPKSTDGEACCDASIPYVPYNIGIAIMCMNIFLPGVGTLVSAYYDPAGCNCGTITCGIF